MREAHHAQSDADFLSKMSIASKEAGACVIQCLNIGKDCMIGAGSVVEKDIPDGVTAYGCPCRVKDTNDNDVKKKHNR